MESELLLLFYFLEVLELLSIIWTIFDFSRLLLPIGLSTDYYAVRNSP